MRIVRSLYHWIVGKGPIMACGAAAALFSWNCAQFYLPGKGFTALVVFGETFGKNSLPELKATNHAEAAGSAGYDGQFYAQLAMHPHLGDPAIRQAMDNLPYRARRMLVSWTAWALGWGHPTRALHIYSVLNIVCWFALAGLLWRWFPAVKWNNFVRWFAVLFSYGLCVSVRRALVDGPGLLLLAVGVALAESGRPWRSAALFGVAGLGRETVLLGVAAFAPLWSKVRGDWIRFAGQVALAGLPLVIWTVVLWRWLGADGEFGAGNFTWPFEGYVGRWHEVVTQLRLQGRESDMKWGLLALVALTVQFLFIGLRPRWKERWWRVGAAYAALLALLGPAVWGGVPEAASRVLLPMTLAFNVLVPRGRAWWAVLLLGNLSVLGSFSVLPLPPPALRPNYTVLGPQEWRVASTGEPVGVEFDDNWDLAERSRFESWRWSRGNAELTFHNPQSFALRATISFGLRSNDVRVAEVMAEDGKSLWHGELTARQLHRVVLEGMVLAPGDTVWRIASDKPAISSSRTVVRPVSVSLRDLTVELVGRK